MRKKFDLRKRLTETQENVLISILLNDSVFHVYSTKVYLVSKQGNKQKIAVSTFDSMKSKNILIKTKKVLDYDIYVLDEVFIRYYNAIFSRGEDSQPFIYRGHNFIPLKRLYNRDKKLNFIHKNEDELSYFPIQNWDYLDFCVVAAENGCYRIDVFEIQEKEYFATPIGLVSLPDK